MKAYQIDEQGRVVAVAHPWEEQDEDKDWQKIVSDHGYMHITGGEFFGFDLYKHEDGERYYLCVDVVFENHDFFIKDFSELIRVAQIVRPLMELLLAGEES